MIKKRLFFLILIISMIIGLSINNISYAEDNDVKESPPFSDGSWVTPDDYKPGDLTNADSIQDMGNNIIGVIQFVGSFLSVIVLVVLGIKYMMGSVEERAEYKKTMWPYIVGAFLLFATTTLLSIIESLSGEI